MPTVLREGGFQFIIFTSDHHPPHIHVRRDGKLAKVLLTRLNLIMMNDNSNQVVSIEYRDDKVFLRLADGREVGNPLNWHPWLGESTLAQREHVELYELSAY